MKIVFDERQLAHEPASYFRRGTIIPHPEQPERAVLLRDALIAAGHERAFPCDHGQGPILAVHDAGFVDALLHAWERLSPTLGPDPIVPTFHPQRRDVRLPASPLGRLGWYSTDTSCPIVEGTAEAIYWSAQTAIEAAERVRSGAETHVYGLCRPPGHHATRDQTMGFCFFNNAAIAAEHLRGRFGRVAILDVDTHQGNGTQDIFWERGDVFFASIHTDPTEYTPFFTGYADERGAGEGEGATLDLVLAPGAGVDDILARYDEALAAVRAFGAEALVVSLGLDMSKDDPLSLVGMTRAGFEAGARKIAALGLPTVLIQEGGYLGPSLSDNAVAFLGAFDEARRA